MTEVTRFDRVEDFEDRARPYLLAREAEHNLILGLSAQIRAGLWSDEPPYLAVVTEDDTVVAVALRTPPHQVTLSHVEDPRAVDALVDDLHDTYGRDLSGVLADRASARRFVDLWMELTGAEATLAMEQRIHSTTVANPPEGVPGEARPPTADELELATRWWRAFAVEATGTEPEENLDERMRRRLGDDPDQGLLLWWDGGRPASMAGFSGPTPNGIRIGGVYTPPELRGRGCATACVAELTRRLLDDGRRFCFLYTDLANPTSNAIYARIGYEPVCDVDQYRFA